MRRRGPAVLGNARSTRARNVRRRARFRSAGVAWRGRRSPRWCGRSRPPCARRPDPASGGWHPRAPA
eukprot:1665-Eustigmatos_ZCMA.PRE.1